MSEQLPLVRLPCFSPGLSTSVFLESYTPFDSQPEIRKALRETPSNKKMHPVTFLRMNDYDFTISVISQMVMTRAWRVQGAFDAIRQGSNLCRKLRELRGSTLKYAITDEFEASGGETTYFFRRNVVSAEEHQDKYLLEVDMRTGTCRFSVLSHYRPEITQ